MYRFEQDFFSLPADDFEVEFMKIKKKYPSFFHDTTIRFKEDVFLCSARQVLLLEKSLKNLLDLRSKTSHTDLAEIAFIVRSSVDLLREVFGEIYNDEVLDSVLVRF